MSNFMWYANKEYIGSGMLLVDWKNYSAIYKNSYKKFSWPALLRRRSVLDMIAIM